MVTALQRPDQPSDTMVPDHNCALTVNIPWSRLWISGGLIDIDRAPVELVSNFKFLGVTITEDLRGPHTPTARLGRPRSLNAPLTASCCAASGTEAAP